LWVDAYIAPSDKPASPFSSAKGGFVNFGLMSRLVTALLLIAVGALLPRPAKADTTTAYAAVVCKGNRALIRFTQAWNDDPPEFTRPGSKEIQDFALMVSEPVDPELDRLVSDRADVYCRTAEKSSCAKQIWRTRTYMEVVVQLPLEHFPYGSAVARSTAVRHGNLDAAIHLN
jgi:hypothetical protein